MAAEYTPITWQELNSVINKEKQDLAEQIMIPSLPFLTESADTYDSLRSEIITALKCPSSRDTFIAGENYDLSFKFLDLFAACSAQKNKNSDHAAFTPFHEYAGILAAADTWNDILGYNRRSIEYKDRRKFANDLTKQPCPIHFSFHGRRLNLNETLKTVKIDELPVRFAVLSIIASTWAVWNRIFEESQKHNLDESSPEIRDTCAKLETLYDAITPQRINWAALLDFMPSLSQPDCMNTFIFPPLQACINKFEAPITDSDDEWSKWFVFKNAGDRDLSQFFNGKQKNLSTDYLTIMTDSSVAKDPFSRRLVSSGNYLYLNEVKKSWEIYIKENPDETNHLEALIKSLYTLINHEHWIMRFNIHGQYIDLRKKLLSIREADLIYQLSVFSIIATTWATWEYCNDIYAVSKKDIKNTDNSGHKITKSKSNIDSCRVKLQNLCSMIFPQEESPEADKTGPLSYTSENPEQLLKTARIAIENDNGTKAVEILTDIVTNYISLASAKTLAGAYEALNICKSRNWNLPAHLSNVRQNELEAKRYGATNTSNVKHSILPEIQKSTSQEGGYYYLRCGDDKEAARYITSTKPENWHPLSDWLKDNTDAALDINIPDILTGQTGILSNHLRFIFAEPDENSNIANALNILDIFKKITDASISEPGEWGNIEIIIRCDQERATPILDTAYSFLDEKREDGRPVFSDNPVKIYLLDEKKRSADLLYAQHPLFYPLTSVRNRLDLSDKTYHLVILSDRANTEDTIWLIRQAFWLLPHTRVPIRSKITVLSPAAEELCYKTTLLCPGFGAYSKKPDGKPMDMDLKRNTDIEDISFPEIEYCTISMDSLDIQNKISEYTSHDILYYIVDLSTDLEGINLAMQIRERSIKKALQHRNLKNYTSDETIVAVRCRDINYANLVTQLIIPKEEEYDNRWFNDYKLIPFGTKSEIFSWDELIGGTIEFLSECMHYQYCTDAYESYDFETPPPADYVWSYHRRLYNRNSSYSAALSLPYRLFEARVVLPGWIFKNKNSYWSQANREELADRIEEIMDPDILDELSKWEHSRWCCYLYSTGWLPATPEETKHYMNNGVTRHSLQIAKLHPCLCSWNDLVSLYTTLHKAYLGTEDNYGNQITNEVFHNFSSDDEESFQGLDTDNIQQTADILRARPIRRENQPVR